MARTRGIEKDEVYVIEANLDDVSGETIGVALEQLMESGAQDVCAIPIFCKKNRPGYMVRVTVRKGELSRFSELLTRATGSFGAKAILYQRYMLPRREHGTDIQIDGKRYTIKMKVAYDKRGNTLRAKPEFSDLLNVSRKTGLSIETLRNKVRMNEEH